MKKIILFRTVIFIAYVTMLCTQVHNIALADNIDISTGELEKARYNLLAHQDLLERQYAESEKRYQNYLQLADQERKRLDKLNSAIKQNEDALRRVEDSLRRH